MAASATDANVAQPFPDGTKDYKPLRTNKQMDLKKPHITELPITWSNWYKHVSWLNVYFILVVPFMGCVAAYFTPLRFYTALFSVIYYFNTGLGITAGMLPSTASLAPPSKTLTP